MKPVPLPLPRCGGRRLGFGVIPVAFILILGTALLSSVSAADELTCLQTDPPGEVKCGTGEKISCCKRGFKGNKSRRWGCDHDPNNCKEATKAYCRKNNDPKKWGEDAFDCYCTTPKCNEPETWEDDPTYQELTMTGPGTSTTPQSKSNAAVVSALLVVVVALGALPHLTTAIF